MKRAIGGRPGSQDDVGPFKSGVVGTEEALLRSLNRRRVQLGWSSRRLDQEIGHSVNLTTILMRGAKSKTSTIFHLLEAMDLEIVLRPKEKKTRLQQAIEKRLTESAAAEEGSGA